MIYGNIGTKNHLKGRQGSPALVAGPYSRNTPCRRRYSRILQPGRKLSHIKHNVRNTDAGDRHRRTGGRLHKPELLRIARLLCSRRHPGPAARYPAVHIPADDPRPAADNARCLHALSQFHADRIRRRPPGSRSTGDGLGGHSGNTAAPAFNFRPYQPFQLRNRGSHRPDRCFTDSDGDIFYRSISPPQEHTQLFQESRTGRTMTFA